MENLVPLGTGNSRLMKSNIPASTTLAQLIQMLNNGTFPYDIGPLNSAGISQQGTPLNKDTLFSAATQAKYPSGIEDPDGALNWLKDNAGAVIGTYPAAIPISAGDVYDVVDGQANASIIAEPGEANLITDSTTYISKLIKLNDTYYVAAYTSQNGIKGWLINNATGERVGSELNLHSFSADYLSLAKLDDNRFVFSYKDTSSGTNYGAVKVGQLSGTMLTVSSGNGAYFEEGTVYNTCVVPLSNTHFLTLCRISDNLRARVCWSDSGVSVFRSSYMGVLTNVIPLCLSGILLPDDSSGNHRVLSVFVDSQNNSYLSATVVSIPKDSMYTSAPTVGTKTVLSTSGVGTNSISLCLFGDKVIISYQSNSEVRLMKVSVSGTTITKEGSDVGVGFNSSYTSLSNNGGTVVLAASGKLSFVDSSTLSVSGTYEFSSGADRNLCEFMDNSSVLVCYTLSNGASMYTQIAKIQNGQLGGKFTQTSTQAIALNSANVGEDVTLLFAGAANLPGATAGTEIISNGIIGEVPVDGMVTALSKGIRNNLIQIYTGSYTGTGTDGSRNPNSIVAPFEPKLVFITGSDSSYGYSAWLNAVSERGEYVRTNSTGNNSISGRTLFVSVSGTTISWYSTGSNESQLNKSDITYYYTAIG